MFLNQSQGCSLDILVVKYLFSQEKLFCVPRTCAMSEMTAPLLLWVIPYNFDKDVKLALYHITGDHSNFL